MTLFLYSALCLVSNGLPSKYTVFSSFLSASTLPISSKLSSLQLLAHSSSRCTRGSRPRTDVIGLFDTSRMRRLVTEDKGCSESSRLCEIYTSVSCGRMARWDKEGEVMRFDCRDRVLRFVSAARFYKEHSVSICFDRLLRVSPQLTLSSVSLFFPRYSSSRLTKLSKFSISYRCHRSASRTHNAAVITVRSNLSYSYSIAAKFQIP